MNLDQTFKVVQNARLAVDDLKIDAIVGNNGNHRFAGALQARSAILSLLDTGLFDIYKNRFYDSAIFRTNTNDAVINTSERNVSMALKNDILNVIDAILAMRDVHFKTASVDSIAIKLPNVDNFEDLSWYSGELNKALAQPIINSEINGETKIESVGNGSIWIYVFLGTPAAIALIAGISWAALVIAKKRMEGQMFEEYVKSMKLKNEMLEAFTEKNKLLLNEITEEECQKIRAEHYKEDNKELYSKLKMSVGIFSELFEKGMEIHPSLTAPEQVSNLFPKLSDFAKMSLPHTDIKKLFPTPTDES